ncbi:MAG: tetratricopeptide repeat protein [Planctomycetota bacterium]|jgi:tetratricopeptide (TPR) repeat protein
MLQRKKLLITAILIYTAIFTVAADAEETRAFVTARPWQIIINLNDFEPADLPETMAILEGTTKDSVAISITSTRIKPDTSSNTVRKLYGRHYALKSAVKETIEEIDVNNVAVIAYKKVQSTATGSNKDSGNIWDFRGYTVKDATAFHIYLSADMTRNTKKHLLDILTSFRVEFSTESQESKKLYGQLDNKTATNDEKMKLISDFLADHPLNSEAYCFLAGHYQSLNEFHKAKETYLKVFENQKTQPLSNKTTLWRLYNGFGRCLSSLDEDKQAMHYLKLGHKLARKTDMPAFVTASSAYNLACLYAKKNRTANTLKYLRIAIKLNSSYKESAKTEPLFKNIKENQRFNDIISQ